MTPKRATFLVTAAILMLAIAVSCSSDQRTSAQTSGQETVKPAKADLKLIKAPNLGLDDLDGKKVEYSQFKGKVVLVDFWATWCGPCRRSVPHLVDVHKKYADRGFAVVGVSLDTGDKKIVRDFVSNMSIPYTVVFGKMQTVQDWAVGPGIPVAYLIDREGNVVERMVGYQEKSVLERKIEQYL